MTDANLLAQLGALSALAIETADVGAIRTCGARDVHLSASRITAAAQGPEHADIVDAALDWAQQDIGKGGNRKLAAIRAVDRLSLEFARRAAALVEGRVSLELDARTAFQTAATVERGRSAAEQLGRAGIAADRVLLKIPATWEGIQAAAKLEKLDIRCHLTLVFGMHQAAACADAGATVVSPAVGRITDWHAKQAKVEDFAPAEDPGVLGCVRMQHYLRRHGYRTELWPSTFRSVEQALALAGCDGIALPTALIHELRSRVGHLERKLDGGSAPSHGIDKLEVDAGRFTSMHNADPVSSAMA
jgi:transaldolase